MINLWRSRRDAELDCVFWKKNENEDYIPNHAREYDRNPDGSFKATKVSPEAKAEDPLAETFMVPIVNLTIKTDEDVSDLNVGDLISILPGKKKYRVTEINTKDIKKERLLSYNNYSVTTYINLRG